MKKDGLIPFLLTLKGNARACVLTEPLWGVPFNLYAPFATVYMYALGLGDIDIGVILSVGLVFQVITALLGGIVTDKWGRRWTTFIVDTASWSIPCLFWMFSQNFWWFMAAAVFNSARFVTFVSWECLWIEDTHPNKITQIYNWVYISGLLAIFFVPIAGLYVNQYELIPVVRVLYGISFVLMTLKFVLTFIFTKETEIGRVRMRETRGIPLYRLLRGYGGVFRHILRSRETVRALILTTLVHIILMVSGTFFSLYATQNLNMPDAFLGYFPILRAGMMLIFMFLLQTRLDRLNPRHMMLSGMAVYGFALILLISAPAGQWLYPAAFTLLDACGAALLMPRMDTMVARTIEPNERARIRSLMCVITMSVAIPFGYLAGFLSDVDRRLPFALNILLFIFMAVTLIFKPRVRRASL
jgi:MFS family permease